MMGKYLAIEVSFVMLKTGQIALRIGCAKQMDMLMIVWKAKSIQISQSILDAALDAVQQTDAAIRPLVHGEGVIDDKAKVNHYHK